MPRRLRTAAAIVVAAAALGAAPAAQAAGAPQVVDRWAANVSTGGVELNGKVNPNGISTSARIQYISAAQYQANIGATPPVDGFSGATFSPVSGVALGAGIAAVVFSRPISGLKASTSYRYRVSATNSAGTVNGEPRTFTTTAPAVPFALPDNRSWEMVSPLDKSGGEIQGPEGVFGGGVLQAAAAGSALTYTSRSSFGPTQGAPGASQYVSRRGGGGWSTENVTAATDSGAFGEQPDGVPFQLFSGNLGRAILAMPKGCAAAPCPWRYGLREGATGAISGSPEAADLRFAGADPDLGTAILSTCRALTANATEASTGPGQCDPAQANLYRWSGGGPTLVNLLPGQTTGTPGAALAASAGAVSTGGSRVYFTQAGNLYLRAGTETVQVDQGVGGGGHFETATPDGSLAFFTKDHRLYRFDANAKAATELATDNGVQGVLGVSPDGSYLYYQSGNGLFQIHGALLTAIALFGNISNYPPATGTARVAANGNLALLSPLPNGESDSHGYSQVYVYAPATATLTCVSCNPTGARALGDSTIPGARANGAAPAPYKPRAFSEDGKRLFFESPDPLVSGDTNNDTDVYEWEAQGSGSCATPGGCVALISSGRDANGASFLDASADGADVFFLTDGSLVPADPGVADVYDARVGGGFAIPLAPIPCTGDACQAVPAAPQDTGPSTDFYRAEVNPPLTFPKEKPAKKKKAKKRKQHHKKNAHSRRAAAKRGVHR